MDVKHNKLTGWLNAQVIVCDPFSSWQLFIILALLPEMTEHHVSVHEEHSLRNYSREGCLLRRQVEKFTRFVLAVCCMVQDRVILPRKDRRSPGTVIKINNYTDICRFTNLFQTHV